MAKQTIYVGYANARKIADEINQYSGWIATNWDNVAGTLEVDYGDDHEEFAAWYDREFPGKED